MNAIGRSLPPCLRRGFARSLVAAHENDLRAAADEDQQPSSSFDVVAGDLEDLARQLGA
jgi:hypothetical protein